MKVLRRRNLVAATDRKSIDAEFIAETKGPMFWVEASACTRGFVLTICRYKTSRPTVCQTSNTKRGERCKLEFNVSYTFHFTLTWICDSDRHYLVSVQIRFYV